MTGQPVLFDPLLPDEEISVVLSGRVYIMQKQWNGRESSWYLHILDEAGEPIVMGVKLVVNFPLARRCQDARMPPGDIILRDTTGKAQNPGLLDLGERHQLYYVETR